MADFKERTDCLFYYEVRDMAASIPTCEIFQKLGYCPCSCFCKYYLHGKTVFSILRSLSIVTADKKEVNSNEQTSSS